MPAAPAVDPINRRRLRVIKEYSERGLSGLCTSQWQCRVETYPTCLTMSFSLEIVSLKSPWNACGTVFRQDNNVILPYRFQPRRGTSLSLPGETQSTPGRSGDIAPFGTSDSNRVQGDPLGSSLKVWTLPNTGVRPAVSSETKSTASVDTA